MLPFTLDQLSRCFDAATFQRGVAYARNGKVLSLDQRGGVLYGLVAGSTVMDYEVSVEVEMARGALHVDGGCTCPMSYNCKHTVAALIAWHARSQATQAASGTAQGLSAATGNWLGRSVTLLNPTGSAFAHAATYTPLIWVLLPRAGDGMIELNLCKMRWRKDGSISGASVLSETWSLFGYGRHTVHPDDVQAVRLFLGMRSGSEYAPACAEPSAAVGHLLLDLALGAGKLYFAATRDDLKGGRLQALQRGAALEGSLHWTTSPEVPDAATLGWLAADGQALDAMLPTTPPLYLRGNQVGELRLGPALTALPVAALSQVVRQAPHVSGREAAAVAQRMMSSGLNRLLPLPPGITETVRDDIQPRPWLRLGSMGPDWQHAQGLDYAVLGFDYDGLRVSSGMPLLRPAPQGTELIERQPAAEAHAAQRLASQGWQAAAADNVTRIGSADALLLASQEAWLHFVREHLPALEADGWLIERMPGFQFNLAAIDDWYASVDEGGAAGNGWFELELGIVVEGQPVPLLPVLLQMIQSAPSQFDPAALAAHADDAHLLTALPDGTRVALPWARIKPILATIGELYFSDRIGAALRLPQVDAARLAELEARSQLRWLGAKGLRALGKKLADFSGIQRVEAPRGLQATLRDYQSEGLAWMQFLREYGLAGILADDMGLGKTIQTLAHILLEKEAGRLDAPALVIAPTSLMGNWMAEAARFAPQLKVLLLQGTQRAAGFTAIPEHDLVLTTYALLPRDEAELRRHRYHLVILDESQYIKNAKAKAAQSATLLDARHRLCLTGTPVQNHLGELWSQFQFLLPGLLGDERSFNADFRKPIERAGDSQRSAFLRQRIRPFMLRRNKDMVAGELPPKTEIVLEVELGSSQRDLYETVRLAMDKKVRAAVASKGVARSQIVILDALLKLRQVCCDPRLMAAAGKCKSDAPSAKLAALLEMLQALLDEGRRILVFSQFTSMLALIEAELQQRKISYALLTGDTIDRSAQVAAFQNGAAPVFLISLKAGGVGLNLTAADTVIHYDPWWNPATENQATDRAWRLGQDKPVFVYKLIAKGTLEERIQQLQQRKAELAGAVMKEGETGQLQLSQEDLQAIFAPL